MTVFDWLFGDRAKLLQAQREAQFKRAAYLALIVACDEEADRAVAGARQEAAESSKVSQAMRSVRPVTMPDAEELKR